jgi:hypothetical protein
MRRLMYKDTVGESSPATIPVLLLGFIRVCTDETWKLTVYRQTSSTWMDHSSLIGARSTSYIHGIKNWTRSDTPSVWVAQRRSKWKRITRSASGCICTLYPRVCTLMTRQKDAEAAIEAVDTNIDSWNQKGQQSILMSLDVCYSYCYFIYIRNPTHVDGRTITVHLCGWEDVVHE